MARIVSLGSALQNIYLIDHDDLASTKVGTSAIFGKVIVGSEVEIDKIKYEVGGGGLNSAITFARNSHETILMANIAPDAAGDAVISVLDKEDIDSSYVNNSVFRTTGTSVILLDSVKGERTILNYPGASQKFGNLKESDLDLIQPDWLHVTSVGGDIELLGRFFKKAHELGAKIMFNPGIKEFERGSELIELLSDVDILIVNKREASRLVPGTILTEILYHLDNYAPCVIVTDGAMGGAAGNRLANEYYRFGIYEDVKVRDVTGAGSAFSSGFLAAYANGKSFYDALVFASANATAVVKSVGANSGILSGNEDLHMMPIQEITL